MDRETRVTESFTGAEDARDQDFRTQTGTPEVMACMYAAPIGIRRGGERIQTAAVVLSFDPKTTVMVTMVVLGTTEGVVQNKSRTGLPVEVDRAIGEMGE